MQDIKKVCVKCYEEKAPEMFIKGHNQCRKCHNAYLVIYRKTRSPIVLEKRAAAQAVYYKKNREKIIAYGASFRKTEEGKKTWRRYKEKIKNNIDMRLKASVRDKTNYAVKIGILKKEPCGRCQSTGLVHAHHEDYSRPLNVVWLCPTHHKERHAELDRMI